MARTELLFAGWRELSPQRQRFVFEQVTRYFLSPLLTIDAIRPVSTAYFGQVFQTFDALIGGEWLRFIPGQNAVTLGVARPFSAAVKEVLTHLDVPSRVATAILAPEQVVDIPPMLVARQSLPLGWQAIGQINLTTQVFRGNHFAYVPYKPTVLQLLQPRVTGVAPSDTPTWPPVLTSGDVTLRLSSTHHYQVLLRQPVDHDNLLKTLGGFGYTLPDHAQYQYLLGGASQSLFTWGNQLPTKWPTYVPNRFGLTVPVRRDGGETLRGGQPAVSMMVSATPTGQDVLALSPFFTGNQTVGVTTRYRKIAVVSLG